jgi:hypothetical protein
MRTIPIEDDSWSDLAAELGVGSKADPFPHVTPDESKPAASEVIPLSVELESPPAEQPDVADVELDDTVVIPALQGEPLAEGSEDAGGEPAGPGRKRRRRRRRRKKGGQPADANGPVEAGSGAEADDEGGEAGDFDEEPDAEGEEDEPASVEEATPEAARDIIATWNVPSWGEIVAGLYRPER